MWPTAKAIRLQSGPMDETPPQPANPVATALQQSLSSGIGLLLWGAIGLYCPTYLHTNGWLTTLIYVIAVFLLIVSVGITLNELATALHNESLSNLGGGAVFVGVTTVLWFFTALKPFNQPWETIAQIAAIVTALLGAIFVANLVAALPAAIIRTPRATPEDAPTRLERQKEQIRSIEALVIAAFSFGAAFVGLITLVLHLVSGK
jgi:MFS family permease